MRRFLARAAAVKAGGLLLVLLPAFFLVQALASPAPYERALGETVVRARLVAWVLEAGGFAALAGNDVATRRLVSSLVDGEVLAPFAGEAARQWTRYLRGESPTFNPVVELGRGKAAARRLLAERVRGAAGIPEQLKPLVLQRFGAAVDRLPERVDFVAAGVPAAWRTAVIEGGALFARWYPWRWLCLLLPLLALLGAFLLADDRRRVAAWAGTAGLAASVAVLVLAVTGQGALASFGRTALAYGGAPAADVGAVASVFVAAWCQPLALAAGVALAGFGALLWWGATARRGD